MMEKPFVGKTYSLYGIGSNSDNYYEQLRIVVNHWVANTGSIKELLSVVLDISKNKRRLKRIAKASSNSTIETFPVQKLLKEFSPFTKSVAEHLRELPLKKRWDRILATSEEQYHLYMLEIELRNRLNAKSFRNCETKLAFLPHCLRDLKAECQSAKHGDDYVCKMCSGVCNINAVSKMLHRHGVQHYIWRTANLRSLFGKLKKEGKHLGVLGIACIPELVSGMRLCANAELPVVGIPLDANRCSRWWGEFYHNTVNLQQLENLLSEGTPKRVSSEGTFFGRSRRLPLLQF
jgi:hypothetical protein